MRRLSSTRPRSPRVLVVDDDPGTRLLFTSWLESAGYDVAEAASGATALKLLRNTIFDIILLDSQMPGMNGREVMTRLRADLRNRSIPVLLVTGDTAVSRRAGGFLRRSRRLPHQAGDRGPARRAHASVAPARRRAGEHPAHHRARARRLPGLGCIRRDPRMEPAGRGDLRLDRSARRSGATPAVTIVATSSRRGLRSSGQPVHRHRRHSSGRRARRARRPPPRWRGDPHRDDDLDGAGREHAHASAPSSGARPPAASSSARCARASAFKS